VPPQLLLILFFLLFDAVPEPESHRERRTWPWAHYHIASSGGCGMAWEAVMWLWTRSCIASSGGCGVPWARTHAKEVARENARQNVRIDAGKNPRLNARKDARYKTASKNVGRYVR